MDDGDAILFLASSIKVKLEISSLFGKREEFLALICQSSLAVLL